LSEEKLAGDPGNVIEATSNRRSSVGFFYSRKISGRQFRTFATIPAISGHGATVNLAFQYRRVFMDKEQSASIGRRGLVATLVALGGAAVAKLISPERAEAGHNTNIAYDSQTVMHLDVTNTTAGSSRISSNISGTAAAVVLNNYPVGISRPDGMLGRTMYTTSNCAGVAGTCENATGGIGVHGGAKSTTGTGVFGFAGSVVSSEPQPGGAGVYGVGPLVGVQGKSNASAIGVRGIGAIGVFGGATDADPVGVQGNTRNGIGTVGVTVANGWGLYGESQSGVALVANSSLGTALVANASTPGTFAGLFGGDVMVQGNFTVAAGFAKSVAVQGRDGELHRMYCMESPEAYFEDFGHGKLDSNGTATVQLDPEFVNIVESKAYDVFLTEYAAGQNLYISNRDVDKFEVKSNTPGAVGEFGYRVVARRKDLKAGRLEKIAKPPIAAEIVRSQSLPKVPTGSDVFVGPPAADEPVNRRRPRRTYGTPPR
jgi:hypothetical protein